MTIIKHIPLFISCLLLAAHFLRADLAPLVLFALALPGFVLIRKQWATRLVQLCLILGAVEWLRTLTIFVAERQEFGEPWLRLACILGGVALFTALSALPLSVKTSACRQK